MKQSCFIVVLKLFGKLPDLFKFSTFYVWMEISQPKKYWDPSLGNCLFLKRGFGCNASFTSSWKWFHFGSFSHCSWRTSKGQPCCTGSIRAQAVSKPFRDPLLGSGTWNTLRRFQLFLKLLLCIQVFVLFKCKLSNPVPELYSVQWVLVHWHTEASNYLYIFILITLLSILTLGNPLW